MSAAARTTTVSPAAPQPAALLLYSRQSIKAAAALSAAAMSESAMSAAASTAALQQTAQQLSNIAATDYVAAATIFQTAAPTS